MATGFNMIREQLNHFWEGLGKSQKRNLIIAAVLLILIFLSVGILLTKKDYVVLYSGLDNQEASEVFLKLKELKAEPKLEGSSTILVPSNKEAELRMMLTKEGYPKSGFNYDLFLSNGSFSQTDSDKKALLTWQLQERLAQSIKILSGVEDAVVTIGMPESDTFVLKSEQIPVTASVIIDVSPGYEISSSQAQNIEQLIAKSVPGLKGENITIIDTNMNVLNVKRSDLNGLLVNNQFDLKNQLEQRITSEVIDLLQPVFGYKKVVAKVNVKLNFDKKVTESVRFEPVLEDTGIILSREKLKEKVQNGTNAGITGEASNTTEYVENDVGDNGSYEKDEEKINYEVNEIKEKIEEDQGKIEDLSISVIIDNEQIDPQTLDQVKELVATSIGTDISRVSVHNMSFDTSIQESLAEQFQNHKKNNSQLLSTTNIIIAAGGFLFLILIIFLFRMNSTIFKGVSERASASQQAKVAIQDVSQEVSEIDLDSSEQNQIKKQLDKFAVQHPDAVANLLRNWLTED